VQHVKWRTIEGVLILITFGRLEAEARLEFLGPLLDCWVIAPVRDPFRVEFEEDSF
jgi:hypothetical protein